MENNSFDYLKRLAEKQTQYGLYEGLLKKTGNYIHHALIEDYNLPEDLFKGLEDTVSEINQLFGIHS